MKTPMQKAIDKVSFVRYMCNDENNEMTVKHVLDTLKEDLNELLEKEKEHIIAAANFLPHDEQNEIKTPEEYYNNKYNYETII